MKNGAGMASNNGISHTKFCKKWLIDSKTEMVEWWGGGQQQHNNLVYFPF
jgi:hypothetical protein